MVLAEEMHFYNKNEKRLAKWYPNSFVVIKGQQVYGGGPSILEAYLSALEKFDIGTFLVLKTTIQFKLNEGEKIAVRVPFFFKLTYPSKLSFT
jgi:hypothetical protein